MNRRPVWILLLLLASLTACVRPAPNSEPWNPSANGIQSEQVDGSAALPTALPSHTPFKPVVHTPGVPIPTPTPDAPRQMPTPRTEPETYVVQAGDSLGKIAQRYQLSLNALISANETTNPDLLEVGQALTIPAPIPGSEGPSFKVIPDSELVNGPASADFDIAAFIQKRAGFLASYSETVDDQEMTGAEIVARVVREYSVSPRLLLSVLEYQSGWVTRSNPPEESRDYPMLLPDAWRKGLYHQLAWAADNLNRGFYLWRINGLSTFVLADNNIVPANGTINAGTAGVQNMFATLLGLEEWKRATGPDGLIATYQELFGYPFDYAIEPLLPEGLSQPNLQLPFENGAVWSFTGGPHGGWGDGSAWAALDFAPPEEGLGCNISPSWVVAMTDGLIVRADNGAVVQDLDGDGVEQTGWTILYMHIASQDRVQVGTYLHAGERIGHPSCEGGVSNGTHTHVARRYNGEWIPADGSLPFVMDGWVSSGTGTQYDGFLTRNEQNLEAWDGRIPENQIQR